MIKSLKPLVAVLTVALAATVSFAQSPKIAIVDMAYLFDNHYKTAEKNAVFQNEQERVKEEVNRLNGEGLALQEEAKTIAEQLNNPVLSEDAKQKIQQEVNQKVTQLQQKQNEMNALLQNSSDSLKKRVMNFRSLLMDEIGKVAVEVAKRQGANLLLDKSGPSLLGMPAVLYYDDGMEISEQVLAEINKNRPADAVAPAATGGPASSSTASEDTPTVSFPGN